MTANAQKTLNEVNGLLNMVDEEGEQARNFALSRCYAFLTRKKIQWTIHTQTLAQIFLDLAFETQKHSNIKQFLKNYRSITQYQHPGSLKHILQYYRDKLQVILDDQISSQSIEFIKNMRNIEDDQASSAVILSSFNPQVKNQREQLRDKLKIVWEGYKVIIDIVRVNQELQEVYRQTLSKIFKFVQKFNRKSQFKSFCEYLHQNLKQLMSKRDKGADNQKNYYIDIQKEQANNNNIQFRLQQFNVTTKLGLWQEAFQILEDIKQLFRIKKGPVKSPIKSSYYEKLALIFKASSYWHYHAFTFFNYYNIYKRKPKLTTQQKTSIADKLILSVLCIPPSTIQEQQSKESQQKIVSMMISATKIPSKEELHNMMITGGVVENASPEIRNLWYFMFLEFNLSSLTKGLRILSELGKKQEYAEYIQLLQDILIYKQLISIAQVYQRMKYSNLMSLIPLPQNRIEKILLQCHNRKVIDFILDEKQGIIIFQDKTQEVNPLQQFNDVFIDIALIREETRKMQRQFIVKKAMEFMKDSNNYYWEYRQHKIDEFEKKMRKPKNELSERERQVQRRIQQQKQREQNQKMIRQAELKKEQEQKAKLTISKNVLINDIIKIKQQRVVRVLPIGSKRIQNLTKQDIEQISMDYLNALLQETKKRVANDTQNRNKKKFQKIDYLEREKRQILKQKTKQLLKESQQERKKNILQNSRQDFKQKQELKELISKVAPQVKQTIKKHYDNNKEKFDSAMKQFKNNLEVEFKKKILTRARQLKKQEEQRREKQRKQRLQQERSQSTSMGEWKFKSDAPKVSQTSSTPEKSEENKPAQDKWGFGKSQNTTSNSSTSNVKTQNKNDGWGRKANTFAQLEVQESKEQKKQKDPSDWRRKSKIEENQKKQPNPTPKFVPPPTTTQKKETKPKGKGW